MIIIIINNYTHHQQLTHRCRMLKLLISHKLSVHFAFLSRLEERKRGSLRQSTDFINTNGFRFVKYDVGESYAGCKGSLDGLEKL